MKLKRLKDDLILCTTYDNIKNVININHITKMYQCDFDNSLEICLLGDIKVVLHGISLDEFINIL